MRPRRRAPLALAALLGAGLAAAADAAAQEGPRSSGSIRRDVAVERVLLDARVTDTRGNVIPDLGARDFRVLVDGRPAEVESVEWIPADRAEVEAAPGAVHAFRTEEGLEAGPATGYPPGRLLVLFFHPDISSYRLKGFLRIANTMRPLLDALLPTDRVAVVSFDSHLKLRLDFTNDRVAIEDAISRAILRGEGRRIAEGPFPSLGARLDAAEAKKAASVDKGLALVARAMEPIQGAKTVLFFGWGFRVDRQPKESNEHLEMLAALERARASVFTLDVSDADWHTLETELVRTAEWTGGTYEKTHLFTEGALLRVTRALAGRYVLVLVKPDGTAGIPSVEVGLVGRKGVVLSRPFRTS